MNKPVNNPHTSEADEVCWFCRQLIPAHELSPHSAAHVRLISLDFVIDKTGKALKSEKQLIIPRCIACASVHKKAAAREAVAACGVGGAPALIVIIWGIGQGRFWFGLLVAGIQFVFWALVVGGLLGLLPLPNKIKRLRFAKKHPAVEHLLRSGQWEIKSVDDP